MSQPLIFSDDEDSQRFSKQLQGMNIVGLVPNDYVPSTRAADKENAAWRANDLIKNENDSVGDYSFTASPTKLPGKLALRDSADPDNQATALSPDASPALSPFTPKKEEVEEDEWAERDGQLTPDETRTPRNAGASTKRRRMLRKIKVGMAEQAEAAQRDGIDMDFVFLGDDTPIAPTPFRLRSSGRRSRVSYRNMDWSSEKTDGKRKRLSALRFDDSEEDREVAREWELERERKERRKKVDRKRKRGQKGTPSTVANGFSLSDDDSLATIAKRMKVEEGGKEEGRGGRKRRERGKSVSTVPESAFTNSDDEPLATIAKRMKKEEEEDGGRRRRKRRERRESTPSLLGSEFNSDDDEPLATIAKRMKKEVKLRRRGECISAELEKNAPTNSDDEPLATIAKRMKRVVKTEEEDGAKKEGERRSLRGKKRGQSTTSVPESAFSISDDDMTLSDIARELKLDKKREKRDKAYQGSKGKKDDEDEAGGKYPIKRRQR